MNPFEAQPPADQPNVAPEQPSGASLLPTPGAEVAPPPSAPSYQPATPHEPLPALPPLPEERSADGRVILTDSSVTVRGREFSLRELERAEITPVKWILWYLLGGLGLAFVMIAFLQNWLHTGPAMLGMALTALLLAYGHRGTNRLRLHRLGREMLNFALPGETPAGTTKPAPAKPATTKPGTTKTTTTPKGKTAGRSSLQPSTTQPTDTISNRTDGPVGEEE